MADEQIVDTHDDAPSMDDTIRATLAEINAREPEIDDAPEETPEEQAERVRDEKGRFAAKQQEETQPETPPEVEPVEEPVLSPEVQRLGLRKEEAAEWAKASPVLQQALLRRSEEMHKGLEQYRGAAQFAQKIAQAFQPYEHTIQQLGVSHEVAVGKLLEADNTLRYGSPEQKAHALASLAYQYGIDIGQVQATPAPDPQVYALQAELNQLKGFINDFQRTQQEREQGTLNSEIAKFAEGREHFEQVREDMAALLQAGRAKDLSDAYEQAVWANPQTRAAMLAKQQAEVAAKVEAERKAQEAKAKRANAVNVPRRGSVPAGAPTGTMDDTIRATAQKLGLF